jgi:hypothetical protein
VKVTLFGFKHLLVQSITRAITVSLFYFLLLALGQQHKGDLLQKHPCENQTRAAIAPSRDAATKSEKRHSRAHEFPNKILSATSFSAQSKVNKERLLHSFSTRRRGQNDFMQFVCSSSALSSRRHAAIIADRVR